MATQTEYTERLVALRPGMVRTTGLKKLISVNVEGAAIGFGKPIAQGDADLGGRATAVGDTSVIGITIEDRGAADDEFKVGDSARVMTFGPTAVEVVAEVSAGDPVHVVVADGTFTNTGGVVVPGARYMTSGAAGTTVAVDL